MTGATKGIHTPWTVMADDLHPTSCFEAPQKSCLSEGAWNRKLPTPAIIQLEAIHVAIASGDRDFRRPWFLWILATTVSVTRLHVQARKLPEERARARLLMNVTSQPPAFKAVCL